MKPPLTNPPPDLDHGADYDTPEKASDFLKERGRFRGRSRDR
jgi:hypothetical protein